MTWAPPDCTLPTAEQPLRVAEFDQLFATALRGQARPGPAHLRLILDGTGEVEATTRDLIARETACCSFFAFNLTRTSGGQLQLDVQVPQGRTEVLTPSPPARPPPRRWRGRRDRRAAQRPGRRGGSPWSTGKLPVATKDNRPGGPRRELTDARPDGN